MTFSAAALASLRALPHSMASVAAMTSVAYLGLPFGSPVPNETKMRRMNQFVYRSVRGRKMARWRVAIIVKIWFSVWQVEHAETEVDTARPAAVLVTISVLPRLSEASLGARSAFQSHVWAAQPKLQARRLKSNWQK